MSECGEYFGKHEVFLETLMVLLLIEIVLYSVHFISSVVKEKEKEAGKYSFRCKYPIFYVISIVTPCFHTCFYH